MQRHQYFSCSAGLASTRFHNLVYSFCDYSRHRWPLWISGILVVCKFSKHTLASHHGRWMGYTICSRINLDTKDSGRLTGCYSFRNSRGFTARIKSWSTFVSDRKHVSNASWNGEPVDVCQLYDQRSLAIDSTVPTELPDLHNGDSLAHHDKRSSVFVHHITVRSQVGPVSRSRHCVRGPSRFIICWGDRENSTGLCLDYKSAIFSCFWGVRRTPGFR